LGLEEEAYKYHQYLYSQFSLPNIQGLAYGKYQIDNSISNIGAIGEMFIQNQEGTGNLLPALPSKCKNGSVLALMLSEVLKYRLSGKTEKFRRQELPLRLALV
jgi:hypothetical protein